MDRGKSDPILLCVVLALTGLGLVMVLSASSIQGLNTYGDTYYFFKRQLMWVFLGLPTMYVLSRLKYHVLIRVSRALLLLSIVGLILVLMPEIGRVVGGSRRWLAIGPFVFQPSELAKISFIVYLAVYLSEKRDRLNHFFRGIVPPLFLLGIIFYLILKEPDLGTAVTISVTTIIMLFASGTPIHHLGILGISAMPALYYFVMGAEYRRQRMLAFLDPWQDPLDTGFHIIQSLYALGSGGLFGLGFGQSKQKFMYLPTPSTDFIFSVLGEELGLLGALTVVGMFFLIAWRGFVIALKAPDTFGMLLAVGLTAMIVFQAIVNIAVVTGSIPVTGISLPFISYGGSSLLIMLSAAGILLNISRYAKR